MGSLVQRSCKSIIHVVFFFFQFIYTIHMIQYYLYILGRTLVEMGDRKGCVGVGVWVCIDGWLGDKRLVYELN